MKIYYNISVVIRKRNKIECLEIDTKYKVNVRNKTKWYHKPMGTNRFFNITSVVTSEWSPEKIK